jgi:hypothetical protein
MNSALRLLLFAGLSSLAACGTAPRPPQWYDKDVTPSGRYHEVRFPDGDDHDIQHLLLRLEKLEPRLSSTGRKFDDANSEATKIAWLLSKESHSCGLARVCEHVLWKISTRPAGMHETFLFTFLSRCQELIFDIGAEDAPLIENLGVYRLRASSRTSVLRTLVDKGIQGHRTYEKHQLGRLYGSLVCDVLERVDWGAVSRIPRESNPASPAFAKSTGEALLKYRDRLAR